MPGQSNAPLIVLSNQTLYQWLKDMNWPREVVLSDNDFEIVRANFAKGGMVSGSCTRNAVIFLGTVFRRTTMPECAPPLDVSTQTLFK